MNCEVRPLHPWITRAVLEKFRLTLYVAPSCSTHNKNSKHLTKNLSSKPSVSGSRKPNQQSAMVTRSIPLHKGTYFTVLQEQRSYDYALHRNSHFQGIIGVRTEDTTLILLGAKNWEPPV